MAQALLGNPVILVALDSSALTTLVGATVAKVAKVATAEQVALEDAAKMAPRA